MLYWKRVVHHSSNNLDYCFCGLCASFANFAVKKEDFTAKNAKIYAKDTKNNRNYSADFSNEFCIP